MAIEIYADTSVFGGAFDPEFSSLSVEFFERVRSGDIQLVVSTVVLDEIRGAPESVRDFFESLTRHIHRVGIEDGAYSLRQAYLRAGVVSEKCEADALHVAMAVVVGCPAIVSWNFKHIVNLKRISMYNKVNQLEGYLPISIHTPPEVVFHDEED